MRKLITLLIISAFLAVSCEPEIDNFEPKAGDADFSSYVALGNSLTAGFMNGELYKTGQMNSYPSILATKFETVGGGDFKQPLMKDELGFGNKQVLGFRTDCKDSTQMMPVPADGSPSPENASPIGDQGPFNNMGVPGAKAFHLIAVAYGQANPYFGRFMSDGNTTILADAMANNPTFFTLWIGSNDVLTYAMEGGEADSITSPAMFAGVMQQILQTLTANGAKGAVANIPDISSLPFFNTVPYNALTLSGQQAQQLTQGYQQYNQNAEALGVDKIEFEAGANALVIEDDSSPYDQLGGIRQIEEDERILLTIPQDSLKCYGMGSQQPVPDEYVLDGKELDEIQQAIDAYNQTISSLTSQMGLAKVDIASRLQEAAQDELRYDGVAYTSEFVSGGLFSLDGIHLTGQGYAIVANEFIEAINAKYGATVPTASVTRYEGVHFP